ncbi:MAG: SRPBCC family protein [Solirubrobacterales bacterium]
MEFENSFELEAPIEAVWDALLDLERVAPCMPGAEVTGRDGDAYQVAVKVRIGPMQMRYKGKVEIVGRDDERWRAEMRANATEARGQGTAAAEIETQLSEVGPVTRCEMRTDVKLSGKAAAMGQGMIRDVSAQLIAEFARNLQAMLAPETAPAAAGETTAAAAQAPPAGAPGPAPSPRPVAAKPAAEGASLEAGALMAKVVAGRLENPRTLVLAAAAFALVFAAIGFVIGWLAR